VEAAGAAAGDEPVGEARGEAGAEHHGRRPGAEIGEALDRIDAEKDAAGNRGDDRAGAGMEDDVGDAEDFGEGDGDNRRHECRPGDEERAEDADDEDFERGIEQRFHRRHGADEGGGEEHLGGDEGGQRIADENGEQPADDGDEDHPSDPIIAASARRSRARSRSLSDFNWPQAARMSRPRGDRIGEA